MGASNVDLTRQRNKVEFSLSPHAKTTSMSQVGVLVAGKK